MKVKIVEDSISPEGNRITTFHVRYWRPIHSELMTHRVFSRNARSSRAVPVMTLLKEDIFVPTFGMNQPGMQSSAVPVDPEILDRWEDEWRQLAEITRSFVKRWGEQGMHKQWANRPLEWFGWIDVLITSTSWENFWALRDHEDAQPELGRLAREMRKALKESRPNSLKPGEWHLPYVKEDEKSSLPIRLQLQLSTARCARLSYRPFDGRADHQAEYARHDKLVVSRPVHASPAEHQATPDQKDWGQGDSYNEKVWLSPELHGNFEGWVQYRKTLENEAVKG